MQSTEWSIFNHTHTFLVNFLLYRYHFVLFNREHFGRAVTVSENWDDDFEFQQGNSDEQRSCIGQFNERRSITSTLEEKGSNTNLPRPASSSTSDLNQHVEQQTENWDDDFEDARNSPKKLLHKHKSSTTDGRKLGRLGGRHRRRQRRLWVRREGGRPHRHGQISTSSSPAIFQFISYDSSTSLASKFLVAPVSTFSFLAQNKPLSKSSTTVHLTALYFRCLLQSTRTKPTTPLRLTSDPLQPLLSSHLLPIRKERERYF